jgi:UDP-N-acetyl-D-mannosaminuronic acid dehydrogenase
VGVVMKIISIVGLGYIGLPTAITAAISGYKVFGFDIDKEKIKKINEGESTIIEKGIKEKLNAALQSGNFTATDHLQESDCFVIAVPTPFLNQFASHSGKIADLSYVFDAAKKVAQVLKSGNLVILESTIPVGTTLKIAKFLEKESGLTLSKDFFVAHCPERVLPGQIFEELVSNDRIIGGVCNQSSIKAKEFYLKFVNGQIYITDHKSAELTKLLENSYRDLNIAFANEISGMAQDIGVDPYDVIELANKHPRVNILKPGCGVGGHCIAVDPWFLIQTFPKNSQTIKTARIINDSKPYYVVEDVVKVVSKLKLRGIVKPKILTLGLTFKPDVDDLRGSPALKIARELDNKKDILEFAVIEPNLDFDVLNNLKFKYFKNLSAGVFWADIVLILVAHSKFSELSHFDLGCHTVIDKCGLMHDLNKQKNNYLNSPLDNNELTF